MGDFEVELSQKLSFNAEVHGFTAPPLPQASNALHGYPYMNHIHVLYMLPSPPPSTHGELHRRCVVHHYLHTHIYTSKEPGMSH